MGDTPRYDCEGTSLAASEPLTGYTVSHSKFHVSAGGDSAPSDARKSCQVAVRIHAPEGYTFAIERAEYRVFADLTRGAGVPPHQLVFMRCGDLRDLISISELRAARGSDRSLLNGVAWDIPGTRSTYDLAWKACP
ncbi:DUF4360 domain-containing protein [Actinomadura meridiana]|uniref:DUF4360 domain-containing protein n=1 Tax=Actinomadura meridiana TaxID=559626 RepID=A0ABP8C5M3_9ACTN